MPRLKDIVYNSEAMICTEYHRSVFWVEDWKVVIIVSVSLVIGGVIGYFLR
jgi:hypothetical protein